MLNTRTVHGLKLMAYIAADSHYLPVTVAKLSSQLGLSVSYTERLVREPNDQGLLSAHRGPGGGYMLQICVDELSVWDVAAFYIYKGIATIAKIYNVSFLLSKSLLVMFIGFFVLTSAQAEISEENALAIKKTVQSQLAAFAADDADLAFSFAAPGIQKLFKTPNNFMAMVQRTYPVVYRPSNILFLKAKVLDSVVVQPVRFWDQGGDVWLAAYNLERQPNGRWLITACVLKRDKSAVDLTTNQLNFLNVIFNNPLNVRKLYFKNQT